MLVGSVLVGCLLCWWFISLMKNNCWFGVCWACVFQSWGTEHWCKPDLWFPDCCQKCLHWHTEWNKDTGEFEICFDSHKEGKCTWVCFIINICPTVHDGLLIFSMQALFGKLCILTSFTDFTLSCQFCWCTPNFKSEQHWKGKNASCIFGGNFLSDQV